MHRLLIESWTQRWPPPPHSRMRHISVSVVGCDVIEEHDVKSDEIAGNSRFSTWREDDTNLKQEMRRSVGPSRGRRHIAHVPVGVGDEVKELEERWNVLRLAPRREHVLCEVVLVVLAPCCTARGRPWRRATWTRLYPCGHRCRDRRSGWSGWRCGAWNPVTRDCGTQPSCHWWP